MTITAASATKQSDVKTNIATGSLTADGNVTDVTLGFTPRHVRVFNETDQLVYEKFAAQVAANTLKVAANGTQTTDTGSGIVFKGAAKADTFKGFELAAAVAVNAKVLHWIAIG